MSGLTICATLNQAVDRLKETTDEARIEAEVLLCHTAELSTTRLLVDGDRVLDSRTLHVFNQAIARRIAGEPIAYITGEKPFYDIDLVVDSNVLIPRSDTELLVDLVLAQTPMGATHRILDLGTGSGAIALSIAKHRPQCTLIAVELNVAACEIAKINAARLQITNVEFVQGSWFEPLSGQRFDTIVSNPPYIAKEDLHLDRGDLRFEPQSALVAADNGLACYKEIVAAAHHYLNSGGSVLFEHGFEQADAIRELFIVNGFTDVSTHRDLGGHERVTMGLL